MIRMITPNTNISSGSIDTLFLKDSAVTTSKISNGAVSLEKIVSPGGTAEDKIMTFNNDTGLVEWAVNSYTVTEEDVTAHEAALTLASSQITDYGTFTSGITVNNSQSIFNANVQINADVDINGDLDVSGTLSGVDAITSDTSFTLTTTASNNITLDSAGYVFADTTDLYVGSFSQAVHITPTSIGQIGTTLDIYGNFIGDLTGNVTGQVSDISNHSINDIAANFNFLGNAAYPGYGIDLLVDESKWAGIQITSYDSSDNPFGIYNPNLIANIAEGSPGAMTAVGSGKRIFSFSGTAANGTSFPATNNAVMSFQTTEAQTSSGRGTKIVLETINTGESSRVVSLEAHGKEITILPAGGANPILDAGGDYLNVDCQTRFNNTIVLDNVSSDPSSPATGAMYFNTSTNKFRGYNGTAWVDLG